MASTRPDHRRRVATFSDSWYEMTYRTFAGVLRAMPTRAPPVLVDYGPVPLTPELSAKAPAWRGLVDGALVYGGTTSDPRAFAAWLRRGEVPTVMMVSDLVGCGIPTVCGDYREFGRLAAVHFASECDCKSFLHLGRNGSMSTLRREEGYRDALATLGQEMHACRVDYASLAEERTPKPLDDPELDSLLQRLPRPIGLFAMTDKMAAAAAAVCRRLGLRIPADVAVLGVGNSSLAHVHSPSLSSIRVYEADVGAAAMHLLHDLMRGGRPPRNPVLIGGAKVHARTSTIGTEHQSTVLTVDVAMERIQASACSGLTVDGLADGLGVSKRTLELLFRRQRDGSPSEEIQRVRFETAALMLRSTNQSVTRIAQVTGFAVTPSFCRFFQRMIGMSPLEYRAAPQAAILRASAGRRSSRGGRPGRRAP